MILKLKKKRNFTAIKNPIFRRCKYCESIGINVSSSEKYIYKYFIRYLHDVYKVKWLHIMLSKTSAYLKSCNGQIK